MEGNVFISFVLPCYNVKDYLEECINSIVNQNINSLSYEIICVDDCSTDGTSELLNMLEEKIEKLKVVRNEKNGGLSHARNVGMEAALGEYVWFVDSDDMLYPGSIMGFAGLLKEHKPDVLSGNLMKVPQDYTLPENAEPFNEKYETGENLISLAPFELTAQKRMTAVWSVVFKRSFYLENNLSFDEDIPMAEDADFYIFFPEKCKVLKSESLCYLYRQREGSIINSPARYKRGYLSNLFILEKYMRLHKDDENIDLKKIETLKYNVANTLVLAEDRAFVKEQLKSLKEKGYYPFKFNKSALRASGGNPIKKLLLFLLPIKPIFLLVNLLNNKLKK